MSNPLYYDSFNTTSQFSPCNNDVNCLLSLASTGDIYSAKKLRSHEIKISDKPEVEDDMVALKAAKQLFKANEDIKLIIQV